MATTESDPIIDPEQARFLNETEIQVFEYLRNRALKPTTSMKWLTSRFIRQGSGVNPYYIGRALVGLSACAHPAFTLKAVGPDDQSRWDMEFDEEHLREIEPAFLVTRYATNSDSFIHTPQYTGPTKCPDCDGDRTHFKHCPYHPESHGVNAIKVGDDDAYPSKTIEIITR